MAIMTVTQVGTLFHMIPSVLCGLQCYYYTFYCNQQHPCLHRNFDLTKNWFTPYILSTDYGKNPNTVDLKQFSNANKTVTQWWIIMELLLLLVKGSSKASKPTTKRIKGADLQLAFPGEPL